MQQPLTTNRMQYEEQLGLCGGVQAVETRPLKTEKNRSWPKQQQTPPSIPQGSLSSRLVLLLPPVGWPQHQLPVDRLTPGGALCVADAPSI
jgi:hypothetical protein